MSHTLTAEVTKRCFNECGHFNACPLYVAMFGMVLGGRYRKEGSQEADIINLAVLHYADDYIQEKVRQRSDRNEEPIDPNAYPALAHLLLPISVESTTPKDFHLDLPTGYEVAAILYEFMCQATYGARIRGILQVQVENEIEK